MSFWHKPKYKQTSCVFFGCGGCILIVFYSVFCSFDAPATVRLTCLSKFTIFYSQFAACGPLQVVGGLHVFLRGAFCSFWIVTCMYLLSMHARVADPFGFTDCVLSLCFLPHVFGPSRSRAGAIRSGVLSSGRLVAR